MNKPNDVEHRLLRVLWCQSSGDKVRYQCSCGHDGPWCRGAPSGTRDRRPFKSASAEARELHACHVEIEQRATQQPALTSPGTSASTTESTP